MAFHLLNKTVKFSVMDIYFPEPMEVARKLLGNPILQGQVLDVTQNELTNKTYVAVLVEQVDGAVVVPVDKLTVL